MDIAADVLAVIRQGTLADGQYRINGQLDRKMYERVNKVLVAAGAKWNRSAQAHVFADVGSIKKLMAAAESGTIQTNQDTGFFPTPKAIVEQMIDASGIPVRGITMRVLEPSAGEGAIVQACIDRGCIVDAVEMDPDRCAKLTPLRATNGSGGRLRVVAHADFMKVKVPFRGKGYDAVLMNPPFANRQDVDHVTRAVAFLKDADSVLVAIMAAGVTFRSDRKTEAFRELVHDRGGWIQPLSEAAFKESGTNVSTVMVKIPGV